MQKATVYNPLADAHKDMDVFKELEGEETTQRVVEVGGKRFTIIQQGPWQLWKITGKGKLPGELSGMYTKYELAQADIEKYLESKKNA